jgi:hypothetical protein
MQNPPAIKDYNYKTERAMVLQSCQLVSRLGNYVKIAMMCGT